MRTTADFAVASQFNVCLCSRRGRGWVGQGTDTRATGCSRARAGCVASAPSTTAALAPSSPASPPRETI
eukprot:7389604-Prymnesium_polylepis.1